MEQTASTSKQITARRRWLLRLTDNPVVAKEFKGRMRGRRAFVLLTVYLGLISVFIILLYGYIYSEAPIANSDPDFMQGIGKAIFGAVVLLELLLISFIGPGLTSGAITSERESQTFDLLRTTLLSARALVFGKLGSAFTFLFLLIFTAIPIQSLAFFLGGVGMPELIVSSLMLVVAALFHCAMGIFFSSFMKRTLTATVSSYASILVSILSLVVIFFVITIVSGSSGIFSEDMGLMILWFMISTNPFLAAIISEVILIQDQSVFYTTSSPFGSMASPLVSPWILYVLFYLALSIVMILFSIYFVNRPDN